MKYPVTKINANDKFVIAQISDLHLGANINSVYHQNFLTVLKKICRHSVDLLILTGDLVNNGATKGYDWLFKTLAQTKIAFLCTAGNHDVTIEKNTHLDFEQRIFLPQKTDCRLLNHHITQLNFSNQKWQVIVLDSTKSGQIDGRFNSITLNWLNTALKITVIPTLIFFHHHPLVVGSAWIDKYQLQNSADFWQIINQYTHVKAIFCGHVHQNQAFKAPTNHPCYVYTAPATSRQFLPHHDAFFLDKKSAGFRLITLENNCFQTQVYRI